MTASSMLQTYCSMSLDSLRSAKSVCEVIVGDLGGLGAKMSDPEVVDDRSGCEKASRCDGGVGFETTRSATILKYCDSI